MAKPALKKVMNIIGGWVVTRQQALYGQGLRPRI
jgi:hypothetical protein